MREFLSFGCDFREKGKVAFRVAIHVLMNGLSSPLSYGFSPRHQRSIPTLPATRVLHCHPPDIRKTFFLRRYPSGFR
jgi:hypothetical protein